MSGTDQRSGAWPDTLGRELLAALPDDELAAQWGVVPAGPGKLMCRGDLRSFLLAWAAQDEEVRRWIISAWRRSRPDVVAAADHALTVGLSISIIRTLESFDAEDVLLAILTDEFEDGVARAGAFVDLADRGDLRRSWNELLQRLVGGLEPDAGRRHRLVILGGHPRDENKLDARLFPRGLFEVRWNPFERRQGAPAVLKAITNALRSADAALIITGMASHALVDVAKEQARRRGIRWWCIPKATDRHVTAALRELFPHDRER